MCVCSNNTPLCIVLEWQETPAGSPKPNALLTNQSTHLQRSNESLQHDITKTFAASALKFCEAVDRPHSARADAWDSDNHNSNETYNFVS